MEVSINQQFYNEIKNSFRVLGMSQNPYIVTYYKRVMKSNESLNNGIHWLCNNYLARYYQSIEQHNLVYKYQEIAIKKCTKDEKAMSIWCMGESYYETKDFKNAKLKFKEAAKLFKETNNFQFRIINIFNYARMSNDPIKSIKNIIRIYQKSLYTTNNFFNSFDNNSDEYLYEMGLYLIELYMRNNNTLQAYRFIKTIKNENVRKQLTKQLDNI